MSGRRWSEEAKARMTELRAQGMNYAQIGREIGETRDRVGNWFRWQERFARDKAPVVETRPAPPVVMLPWVTKARLMAGP